MGFFDRAKRALFGGSATPPERAPSSAVPGAAQSAESVSPEQAFVNQVLEVLHREERLVRVEQDAEDVLTLRVWLEDSDQPAVLFLNNLRRDTLELPPDEKLANIERFVGIFTQDSSTEWSDVEGSLVPLLRTSAFVGYMQLEALVQPFAGHLLEVVGIDRPDSIAIATLEQLEEWPISAQQAFDSARQLMRSCADAERLERWDPEAPYAMWQLVTEDSYESSRLAVPGWLAGYAERVEGRPLCIVPARNFLVLSGDQDPAAVCRLFETALAEFQSASRVLSPMVYCADQAGNVVEYEPPGDHPARGLYQRNRLLFDLAEYEDQKQKLEEDLEEQGVDVFVASLSVITKADDPTQYLSYAVWVEGVDTLLPKADFVALMRSANGDQAADHFMVPWETALVLTEELMQEEAGVLPKRWRLKSFPGPALLEALRATAVEL